MFYVGQKVVALKTLSERHCLNIVPQKDKVYIVRTVEYGTDGYYLRFEELVNPIVATNRGESAQPHFWAKHFAPLQNIAAEIDELCERILRETKINGILTI